MKKFFLIALFLSSVVLAEELKILAVVNNEVITQAELDRAMAPVYLQMQSALSPEELSTKVPQVRLKVLQQLIEEKLMLQEARNPKPVEVSKGKIGIPSAITVSETEVDEMISQTGAKFENPEAFMEALHQQGVSLEDLKARYRDEITVRKLIGREIHSKVVVSPAEVTSYFAAHEKDFQTSPAAQVAMILIKPKDVLDVSRARDLAQDLYNRLQKGADFYDLAQRYSDGPNAKMGGRLGFLEKGKALKEIDSALFTLKAGEVSPVISVPSGFHIFRVESIRPARQAQLEEVKDRIRDRLFQEKAGRRYQEWMEHLKASAYISIQEKEHASS